MLAEVAGPDQPAAKKMRPGYCTKKSTAGVIIVYRVNLKKLSRNFVGALRTTTNNCIVSFIDLYLVFPSSYLYSRLRDGNGCVARTMEPECLMPSK